MRQLPPQLKLLFQLVVFAMFLGWSQACSASEGFSESDADKPAPAKFEFPAIINTNTAAAEAKARAADTNTEPLTAEAENNPNKKSKHPSAFTLEGQVARHSPELPASSNFVSEVPPVTTEPQRIKVFEKKLEQAQEARKNKDYSTAEEDLLFILTNKSPEALKGSALLEYAALALEQKKLARALQIYAQWVRMFPNHPDLPEVLLRQGLICRDMGAPEMAIQKFFSVMGTSLNQDVDRLPYYRKIVLRAQTEIADTYYLQGRYESAISKYQVLLKPSNPDYEQLNRSEVLFKLIRSYSQLHRYSEVVGQSEVFLHDFPNANEQPDIRYLMASALKKLGRNEESIQQTLILLQSQQTNSSPERLKYWQQRTGNDIANQLFEQGDLLNALTVYTKLAELDNTPAWQLPVFYQIGLIYEQLKDQAKAMDYYQKIISQEKALATGTPNPNLATVLEMAKFRVNRLSWQLRTERVEKDLSPAVRTASSE